MKEIVVEEILSYSGKIEMESYRLYKESTALISDNEVKKLAEDLAEEEMKHYNRINQLLEGSRISEEELKKKMQIPRAHYQTLVSERTLPVNPTAMELLKVAYERERNTKDVYMALTNITNLNEDVVKLFEELMNQEEGHALRIKNLMKKY